MKYCKNCILPDSRPNLTIMEDEICNGCHASFEKEKEIDWQKRDEAFKNVVKYAKEKSQGYDCLIPVSGGKDSTWQVIKCLEHGLNVLALTWRPPGRTKIGQQNLDNLISLGVDHIDYSINPKVESKFTLKTLKKLGNPAVPMHFGLFNIPLTVAAKYDIPMVVWGENPAFEYGSEEDESRGFLLNDSWIRKYGVTHGTIASDWISEDLTEKELMPYRRPTDQELNEKGIRALFMGYYFRWSPQESLRVAEENGFRRAEDGPKTGLYNYADIDDDFISVHHYIKWYKFGMTRLFDNLSLEIRNGKLTREQALEILKEKGEQRPDEDIDKFCKFLNISREEFFEIIEKFRNHDIWQKENGVWKIKDFIINDWQW